MNYSLDLRPTFGPVEFQGSGNSCVPHAVTSALEATLGVQDLSRLFVYWNARAYVNQTGGDFGCQPRNAVRGVREFGVPLETSWPFDRTRVTTRPPASAFTEAKPLSAQVKAYQSVTSLAAMKSAMIAGQPVVFGMLVPDTFTSVAKFTGVLPMWTSTTRWIGRHAMVTAGFDDDRRVILARNSFGPTWGNGGYCEMSYDWFSTISSSSRISDCWTFVKA